MNNKKSSKTVIVFLGLLASLIWLAVFSFPDNRLHLVFCDVGQGDATLITKGFSQILIDGGPSDKVLECLSNNMPFWDRKIEIVALTHPEADHLVGLISILDKYKADYFLLGPEGNETATYQKLMKGIETLGFCKGTPCRTARRPLMKVVNPYAGEKIKLGEITLNSLWPEREWVMGKLDDEDGFIRSRLAQQGETLRRGGAILGASTIHKNLNDFSLVFLMEYQGKKVLLMGDADSRVQDKIISANGLLLTALSGIDILKFPHHGSKTGMTEEFLQKISPKEAVISVGKNSFGHPTKEALELLKRFNVAVRRTDVEGEIRYTF